MTPAGLLALALALQAPSGAQPQPARGTAGVELTEAEVQRLLKLSPLPPPPPDPTNAFADDARAARLGQRLFFDARLSRDGTLACATCHDPARAFTEEKGVSAGLGQGSRHAPSLLNVAHQRWLFWDGRADTLWSQALQPIESDSEMGSTRVGAVALVGADTSLRAAYEQVFGALPEAGDERRFPRRARPRPEQPEHAEHAAWLSMAEGDRSAVDRAFANLGKSIEAYERRLLTGPAPFDAFVAGLRSGGTEEPAAISAAARRGAKLFVGKAGCRLCHGGPNLSDGEFHDIGLAAPGGGAPSDPGRHAGIEKLLASPFNALSPFSDAREGEKADTLRHLARGPQNWGEFKTPSLRNVALTAPYMHQGHFATLDEILRFYSTRQGARPPGHHQEQILQPLFFTDQEQADLRAFLESLTGAPPAEELLRPPAP